MHKTNSSPLRERSASALVQLHQLHYLNLEVTSLYNLLFVTLINRAFASPYITVSSKLFITADKNSFLASTLSTWACTRTVVWRGKGLK